jgi:hypothetical protein
MKKYILKEYGSWSVVLMAYLIGILSAGGFNIKAAFSLVSIVLFINSKQAFTLWMRGIEPERSLKIFIGQIAAASLMLFVSMGVGIVGFLPYALIPISYILLLYYKSEHAIITELFGFGLLTISSLLSRFAVTGEIEHRLYAAVFVFFGASIFKVKLHLKKGVSEKISMLCYLAASALAYRLINMPLIMLLPLLDNLIFSLKPYAVKLKAIGWIEALKGIVFAILITALH